MTQSATAMRIRHLVGAVVAGGAIPLSIALAPTPTANADPPCGNASEPPPVWIAHLHSQQCLSCMAAAGRSGGNTLPCTGPIGTNPQLDPRCARYQLPSDNAICNDRVLRGLPPSDTPG